MEGLSIDQIYIIGKKYDYINQNNCEEQLVKNNLLNYTFIDAIFPSEHYNLKIMYKEICKSMNPNFIKYNFPMGALGVYCLILK